MVFICHRPKAFREKIVWKMFPVLDLRLNREPSYLWEEKLLLLIPAILSEQLRWCRAKSDFQILQDPRRAGTEEKRLFYKCPAEK